MDEVKIEISTEELDKLIDIIGEYYDDEKSDEFDTPETEEFYRILLEKLEKAREEILNQEDWSGHDPASHQQKVK